MQLLQDDLQHRVANGDQISPMELTAAARLPFAVHEDLLELE